MSQRSYYSSSLTDFLYESSDSIIGKITQNHSQNLEHLQTNAWRRQIDILKDALRLIKSGYLLFEVLVPRMGKRVDVVLIAENLIFVLEFKVGEKQYLSQDLRQAHSYALDLSCFHAGSHGRTIIPILVATEADIVMPIYHCGVDHVYQPLKANKENLGSVIGDCINMIKPEYLFSCEEWVNAQYKPTPTIIEAAQALYANHKVSDIARNDAGAKNLHLTSKRIQDLVHLARKNKRKIICFVTGVPGAGKTLVGLNIATENSNNANDEHAVFLSGNGPLVEVLREALARDQVSRKDAASKTEATRKVAQFIQNIHHFRDEYLQYEDKPPADKVVIFDEAQRAWDRHNTTKFMAQKKGKENFNQSEPEFLISVMDRHKDWCVIIALIGGGQEINTGEAGLHGWIDALSSRFHHWDVYFSEKLSQVEYAGRDVNFSAVANALSESSLHLATSMRSFRAEQLSHMVHYLIHNQADKAFDCYQKFRGKFPIKVTRDIKQAKLWIASQARGLETKGVVASSGAIRLKAEGLFVKNRIAAADWFLNDAEDIRSCHFLEDVATEFDIQGLELDWCLVGWDADYRYVNGAFEHWRFTGTSWKQRQQDEQKRFLENAYRVLLTRARQGMVIFVPNGAHDDITRRAQFYDGTFNYLQSCGIESI